MYDLFHADKSTTSIMLKPSTSIPRRDVKSSNEGNYSFEDFQSDLGKNKTMEIHINLNVFESTRPPVEAGNLINNNVGLLYTNEFTNFATTSLLSSQQPLPDPLSEGDSTGSSCLIDSLLRSNETEEEYCDEREADRVQNRSALIDPSDVKSYHDLSASLVGGDLSSCSAAWTTTSATTSYPPCDAFLLPTIKVEGQATPVVQNWTTTLINNQSTSQSVSCDGVGSNQQRWNAATNDGLLAIGWTEQNHPLNTQSEDHLTLPNLESSTKRTRRGRTKKEKLRRSSEPDHKTLMRTGMDAEAFEVLLYADVKGNTIAHLVDPRDEQQRRSAEEAMMQVSDQPPTQPGDWDIREYKLPMRFQIDSYKLWPNGSKSYVYLASCERARRHQSGWAMRNTNNHNPQVLKKSCLGVLECSAACLVDGRKLALRPAICDKARRKQLNRPCSTPGCNGHIYLRQCRGHGGYPVTHFWRFFADFVFFEAKGQHDHDQPSLKTFSYSSSSPFQQREAICEPVGEDHKTSRNNSDRKRRATDASNTSDSEQSLKFDPMDQFGSTDQQDALLCQTSIKSESLNRSIDLDEGGTYSSPVSNAQLDMEDANSIQVNNLVVKRGRKKKMRLALSAQSSVQQHSTSSVGLVDCAQSVIQNGVLAVTAPMNQRRPDTNYCAHNTGLYYLPTPSSTSISSTPIETGLATTSCQGDSTLFELQPHSGQLLSVEKQQPLYWIEVPNNSVPCTIVNNQSMSIDVKAQKQLLGKSQSTLQSIPIHSSDNNSYLALSSATNPGHFSSLQWPPSNNMDNYLPVPVNYRQATSQLPSIEHCLSRKSSKVPSTTSSSSSHSRANGTNQIKTTTSSNQAGLCKNVMNLANNTPYSSTGQQYCNIDNFNWYNGLQNQPQVTNILYKDQLRVQPVDFQDDIKKIKVQELPDWSFD